MRDMKEICSTAYGNIKQRCGNPRASKYKCYGGKGIKCLITTKQLIDIYIRDKAELMKQPSVDRIDPFGNYCPENVRWLEFDENRRRRAIKEEPVSDCTKTKEGPRERYKRIKKSVIFIRASHEEKEKISKAAMNMGMSESKFGIYAILKFLENTPCQKC